MYRNLNDYEILYMVCENGDNTFEIMYQKYKPLIYKEIKSYIPRFKKYGYDIDDLMQIGAITLYKAMYLYNDSNNSMFYTYYKNALRNSLNTEIRKNETLKKQTLNNSLSYDVCIANSDTLYRDVFPSKESNYNVDYINFIVSFKNSLSFKDGNIFELYYNGYSISEISILLDYKINIIKESIHDIKEFAFTYKCLFLN